MKPQSLITLITAVFFLSHCADNNAATNEKHHVNNPSSENKPEQTLNTSAQGDVIVGKWRLTWEAYDENGNKKLDEEERKKGFANKYFYQFNADGSCVIQNLKGRYEIKEEGGKKKLSTYTDVDGSKDLIGNYTILSVNKDELLLLDAGADFTFWTFKREK